MTFAVDNEFEGSARRNRFAQLPKVLSNVAHRNIVFFAVFDFLGSFPCKHQQLNGWLCNCLQVRFSVLAFTGSWRAQSNSQDEQANRTRFCNHHLSQYTTRLMLDG